MIPPAHAQGRFVNPTIYPQADWTFASVVGSLIPIFSLVGAFIFLVMLFYGAWVYLSGGEKSVESINKAKGIITWAGVGLFVIIFSYTLVQIVIYMTGAESIF